MREIALPPLFMLLSVAVAFASCGSEKGGLRIPTARGVEIEALLDRPEGADKFPAIVVAPGQGYHMRLALFEELATQCVQKGIVCLRFDWDFYTKEEDPSAGFTKEKEDLSGAIDYLRGLDFIDQERVFVCGKSIGALVGIDIATKNRGLRGLVILTFALHPTRPPYKVWPEARRLEEVKVPVLIVSGRADPICRREILDSLVNTLPERPEIFYVGGDHSLKGSTEEETEQNQAKAVEAVLEFVRRNL